MTDQVNIDKRRDRLEVYNTIILAIATLAVTWCSYQAALWNGVQTFSLAESNKYSRLAQQKTIQAGQNMAMDEAILITFVEAVFNKDKEKIDLILKGVRPEMNDVMTEWMNNNPLKNSSATLNPLLIPKYQELMNRRLAESGQMTKKSETAFDEGRHANTNADRYSLLTVLFSMVMFLGAITTKLVRTNLRLVLTVISAIICIGVLLIVFFDMPIAHKG